MNSAAAAVGDGGSLGESASNTLSRPSSESPRSGRQEDLRAASFSSSSPASPEDSDADPAWHGRWCAPPREQRAGGGRGGRRHGPAAVAEAERREAERRGAGSESPNRLRSRSLSSLHSSSPVPGGPCIFPPGIVFGIDIGGTLGKIVFREPDDTMQGPCAAQVKRLRAYFMSSSAFFESDGAAGPGLDGPGPTRAAAFGGTLRFLSFETRNIDQLFEMIRQGRFASPEQVSAWKIFATGGGSFKFGTRFWRELGVHLRKSDEMETLVSGVECLIDNLPDACYTYVPPDDAPPPPSPSHHGGKAVMEDPAAYVRRTVHLDTLGARKPWLVVNVGSGVSMLKIDEQRTVLHGPVSTYKRVGGTPLGGGTFLALGCLLTGVNSHMELIDLAERGDSTAADKLVGDIYGDEYRGLGLSADTVASNFGKLVSPDARAAVRREDLAAALLQMISWNLAQLARLVAQQEGCKTIVFTGSFMHQNQLAQRKIVSAIRYWSNRESVALYMRHEGYVGAVGALAMSSLHK